MATLTCPYCGHAIESEDPTHALEVCPHCGGELLVAYRYRLVRTRGEVAGGILYEALDAGFDNKVAVLFVANPDDAEASARFVAGHQLFANLRTRGLVTIHDVARSSHRRPYVVMDWLAGGTLDHVVQKRGPLDPDAVWAMTSDLLIGLERAHRALPALVHGHIYPGKIGFRGQGQAVLFGFEWARLVSEQDSNLADSFQVREHAGEQERASSLDLRELTRAIVYAATGRWLERGPSMREQVAALMPGPLAPFLDRLCCAGTPDGYHSTSVARDEFELLRAGGNARRRVGQLRPVGHAMLDADDDDDDDAAAPAHAEHDDDAHDDDAHDDEVHDDELHEVVKRSPPPPPGRSSFPSKAAASRDAEHGALLEQIRQRQAQLAAESSTSTSASASAAKPNGGRIAMLLVFGTMGMCTFGAIVANTSENSTPPPPQIRAEPYDWSAPAQPQVVPSPIEPAVEAELAQPGLAQLQWVGGVAAGGVGPLGKGATCRLAVFPRPEEPELRCYWTLDCLANDASASWVRYYGNEGSGMTRCEFDEQGHVITASDLDDDDGDALFVFDQRSEPPRVLFGDRFAVPPSVMLIDVGQPVELSDGPSATPLERHGSALELDAKQFAAATRAIHKLATKLGVEPQLASLADAVAAELPDELDAVTASETVALLDYAACSPPEGLVVKVEVEVAGATGKPTRVDLGELEAGSLRRCLQRTISAAELGRFNAASATLSLELEW